MKEDVSETQSEPIKPEEIHEVEHKGSPSGEDENASVPQQKPKSTFSVPPKRRPGRTRKNDPLRVPYEEIDKLIVYGELVPCDTNPEKSTIEYPSYREIARRYNVAHSLISEYAKRHNCLQRRKRTQARVEAQVEKKIVDARSESIAIEKEDALRIIDAYLLKFEKALVEERIRYDNPSDFNTMVRLKEFLQGGADSRQELHASLSLEDLQARHAKAIEAKALIKTGETKNLEDKEQPVKERPSKEARPSSEDTDKSPLNLAVQTASSLEKSESSKDAK